MILTVIATLAWGINTAQGQHAVTEGLVSYWSFDSGTIEGTTAKDSWGNNHGTIEGTPQSVPGKVGEALEFNGVDQDVLVEDPADGSLDFGTDSDFTLEAWARPLEGTKKSMRIMDKKSGPDVGYVLEHN